MYKILEKEFLAAEVCKLVIEAPQIAKKRKAGQFVLLRIDERGERIPLTIAAGDPERGSITIILQTIGATTTRMSRLEPGDFLLNVVGPLGVPTHVDNYGTVACIGGGVGIAVLYPITQALKAAGNHVVGILGARNEELLILEDEMKACTDRLEISTDDGSKGTKGFVTTVLGNLIDEGIKPDWIMAIGPVPMMRSVVNMTRPMEIPTWVSLNPIMVDGTGMCGACRVSIGDETKFACVDGPDFDGFKVDFDELTLRLRMYNKQEAIAREHDSECCGKCGDKAHENQGSNEDSPSAHARAGSGGEGQELQRGA
jgi:ferredoxin--NADP+ reductase